MIYRHTWSHIISYHCVTIGCMLNKMTTKWFRTTRSSGNCKRLLLRVVTSGLTGILLQRLWFYEGLLENSIVSLGLHKGGTYCLDLLHGSKKSSSIQQSWFDLKSLAASHFSEVFGRHHDGSPLVGPTNIDSPSLPRGPWCHAFGLGLNQKNQWFIDQSC